LELRNVIWILENIVYVRKVSGLGASASEETNKLVNGYALQMLDFVFYGLNFLNSFLCDRGDFDF